MSDRTLLGDRLDNLAYNQAVWSQETFGADSVRGPAGPLKHLIKEAQECIDNPSDIVEYADCFLLVLDASRRAGFSVFELVKAAQDKLKVNKARQWPKVNDMNVEVEHLK